MKTIRPTHTGWLLPCAPVMAACPHGEWLFTARWGGLGALLLWLCLFLHEIAWVMRTAEEPGQPDAFNYWKRLKPLPECTEAICEAMQSECAHPIRNGNLLIFNTTPLAVKVADILATYGIERGSMGAFVFFNGFQDCVEMAPWKLEDVRAAHAKTNAHNPNFIFLRKQAGPSPLPPRYEIGWRFAESVFGFSREPVLWTLPAPLPDAPTGYRYYSGDEICDFCQEPAEFVRSQQGGGDEWEAELFCHQCAVERLENQQHCQDAD